LRRATIAAGIALAVAATDARAEDPGRHDKDDAPLDVVVLRAGATLRGRLVEIVPEDHVTLAIGAAEPRRLAWSEIDHVAAGADDPPAAARAVPLVPVHVVSPHRVQVFRRLPDSGVWMHVCSSPCDARLPARDTYRVQAADIDRSPEFQLAPGPQRTDLVVDPSSTAGKATGIVAAILGGTTALVGLGMLAARETRGAGLVALGFGGLLGVGGIVVFRLSSKTVVTQGGGEPR
jgi:hypothetical protein